MNSLKLVEVEMETVGVVEEEAALKGAALVAGAPGVETVWIEMDLVAGALGGETVQIEVGLEAEVVRIEVVSEAEVVSLVLASEAEAVGGIKVVAEVWKGDWSPSNRTDEKKSFDWGKDSDSNGNGWKGGWSSTSITSEKSSVTSGMKGVTLHGSHPVHPVAIRAGAEIEAAEAIDGTVDCKPFMPVLYLLLHSSLSCIVFVSW